MNSSEKNILQTDIINDIVIAISPAIAMGNLYVTTAWNTGQSMSNAVYAQQLGYATMQMETALAVRKLLRY